MARVLRLMLRVVGHPKNPVWLEMHLEIYRPIELASLEFRHPSVLDRPRYQTFLFHCVKTHQSRSCHRHLHRLLVSVVSVLVVHILSQRTDGF